ncbi:MAG TPA: RNB domain-containing ribonuclease, partial [Burkholderiales bacterium]|nr:RNB domain-containing ribonuclease [Burkholderiales bacterium]
MSKKKAKRTALRRRNRADREQAPDPGRILEALNAARAPLKPDELAARLHVPRHAQREFDRALAALERAGEVMQNRAGSLLVAKRIALIAGRVEGHPDGHGFLAPDDRGPSVFLPPAEMRQLMHGDRAAVRVVGRDSRGRAIGEVVEVLERSNRRIVGRLHSEHGVLFLVPEDRRIAHDILVPPAEAGKAKPGQVVTVDLVAQPGRQAQPIGRVAEVLGHHADPGMEIEIAVRKFDLPHEFSKKALAQARAFPDEVEFQDSENRRDLRDLHFVTIDGETAKDFDDAVFCRKEGKGFRLWVAIADVSHYVRHGDALDLEASERGTSVYFPRRVIPMLPEKLSNGLCSLNPHVDRLAMVCEM